ncbi:MAG: DUF922 domain-containing protein [Candidatus Tokpelaia sp.]|uniref:DUF922 domain-containing protein n=1 Tax=Candidatus Tokpelaia sp. TaxID=2233777 RepID=UPI00123A8995|nr:DUF922 domain-containing protein [Candidatus Tokpelaia sp.]KAA6204797.1 MAG: DUF922 domain-containing protein [Candidatus Tokpelaia sp.]KAA6207626.1 MAG: DUF922 domain-containing protein [Candidatus Tokpelaia sp.]KAA6404799.1 hypothetical protein DPQ22_07715 [Candidatus Tokpelaia sp.]
MTGAAVTRFLTLLGLTIALSGALEGAAAAITVRLSYHYYTISAQTIDGLQSALNRYGPYIAETGRHHAAAAIISFQHTVKLAPAGAYCRVMQADISIKAQLYLPQWQQRQDSKDSAVTLFWDMLLRDIKRHEENHIIIARHYGNAMEQELRNLPYRRHCRQLQQETETVLQRLEQKNDSAQMRFDYIEGRSFKQRLNSLVHKAGQKHKMPAGTKLRSHP